MEDREWLADVEPEIQKSDGHFVVPIPKAETSRLPDSFPTAKKRFEGLQKRFQKDKSFFHKYRDVVQGLIDDGYAEKIPVGERDSREVWYVPHHAVVHPEKQKVRVVFDCAAKTSGISLNDLSKKGPFVRSERFGDPCLHRGLMTRA